MIVPHIESYVRKHSKVYVVCFIYLSTRQKIVTGVYRKVIGNCRHPKSWNNFIRCDENKTEIFGFFVDKFILAQNYAQVIVTKRNDVVCNVEIKFFKTLSSDVLKESTMA